MTSSCTSVTSEPLLLSSRSAGHSLQSPQLQAEFLQVFQDKFQSRRDIRESSVVSPMSSVFSPSPSSTSPVSSPFTPSPISPTLSSSSCSSSSPSSPCYDNRRGPLSLSSPELLSELKDSRPRLLRRVRIHNGLTTVFSGRGGGGGGGGGGGQTSGPTPSARPTNQMPPC